MAKITVVALTEVRGLLAPLKNGAEHVLLEGEELLIEASDEIKNLVAQGVLRLKEAVAKLTDKE